MSSESYRRVIGTNKMFLIFYYFTTTTSLENRLIKGLRGGGSKIKSDSKLILLPLFDGKFKGCLQKCCTDFAFMLCK